MKLLTDLILVLAFAINLQAATSLENAAITPVGLAGNDIVYDSTRNVLYMSVPSTAGFPYGNSIVTIDPNTGQIIHSTFIGSAPDKLAIASDGSRVYIGVDGAYSFCWWEPANDTVSELVPFTMPWPFGPYIANDFSIAPADPHTVVVSKADVSSSADGDLELFNDDFSLQELDLIYGPESICFTDSTNLIGFNNGDTGFDLWKWSFNGSHLIQTQDVEDVISGFDTRIKSVDGLIFSDDGKVVGSSKLVALGTFFGIPYSAAVEPIPGTNTVYFLGDSDGNLQLASFDRKTFLKFDTMTFTNATSGPMRSLVRAGNEPSGGDRLAFLQYDGSAGIINIPPPAFAIQRLLLNGSISQLIWTSETGRQYQVQCSPDLTNWTTFLTVTAIQFHTTNTFYPAQGHACEFYRVVAK